MGWMLVSGIAVLIAVWFFLRSGKWTTIMVSNGMNAEQLEAKYAYLKTNQIKCKLDTEAAATADMVRPGFGGTAGQSVKLKVHQKDVERANLLLEQFDKETRPY